MNVTVLVSMIAGGKSTYSKNAAKRGALVINDDAIVTMLHGGNYELYNQYFKPLYKSIENHIFSMAVAMDQNIIIDRGVDISVTARQRWIALARTYDVKIHALVFPKESAYIHGHRRWRTDNRGLAGDYWQEVAKAHEARYIVPTIEEGFDAVEYITWPEIQSGKVISF